jgi:integral membrane protein
MRLARYRAPMLPDVARLRWVGFIEGVSFLVLVLVGMPLKYALDWPWVVKVAGPIHGALFVLYFTLLFLVWRRHAWPLGRVVVCATASLLPFGPWLIDRQMRGEFVAPR